MKRVTPRTKANVIRRRCKENKQKRRLKGKPRPSAAAHIISCVRVRRREGSMCVCICVCVLSHNQVACTVGVQKRSQNTFGSSRRMRQRRSRSSSTNNNSHTNTTTTAYNKKRKEGMGTLFFFFLSCTTLQPRRHYCVLAQRSTTAIRTHCRIDIDHILLLSLSAAVKLLADRRHATCVLYDVYFSDWHSSIIVIIIIVIL